MNEYAASASNKQKDRVIGAVDIGGTKIAVGLIDRAGQTLARRAVITSKCASGAAGVLAIRAALEECLQELDVALCGIGIGCTGPVHPLTGTVGRVANLPGWADYPIVRVLSEGFRVPVAMENDADAAALAEHRWGSGRGVDRFLYVTLSTGIGAGLILNGRIFRGRNGSHPEMGHHTIDPAGPACYCGANGCWESLASGVAIKQWFLQNSEQATLYPESFGARDIFALARADDALAQAAVARLSRYVGIGLANLITMLVPDVIALGGGLTLCSDAFLPAAMAYMTATCREVPVQDTMVCVAALREQVGLAGAAAVWCSRYEM